MPDRVFYLLSTVGGIIAVVGSIWLIRAERIARRPLSIEKGLTPVYKEQGGGRFDMMNFTIPFVRIATFKDFVTISCISHQIVLHKGDIERIEREQHLISTGLRLHHHRPDLPTILLWPHITERLETALKASLLSYPQVTLTCGEVDYMFKITTYVIVWLTGVLIIVFGLSSLNWFTYYHLANRGKLGQATVLALLPKIHNTVSYQYKVNGQNFRGQTQLWDPNPSMEKLKIGDTLVVYYDPVHPEKSVLGDPHMILNNETISIALAAIMFPTILVISISRSIRNRSKRESKTAIP